MYSLLPEFTSKILYLSITLYKNRLSHSKCDQIRKKLRIRSHLLEKFLMENFIYLLCSDKAEYLLLLPGFFELHVFPIRCSLLIFVQYRKVAIRSDVPT